MLLPASAPCLTTISNPGVGKVNPTASEDFQIIPGRGRKASLGPAG